MRVQKRALSFVICGMIPTLAFGGQLPERFTLGRYVPGDVWLFLNTAHNDENAWLSKKWSGVFEALKASGIDRDITSMILSAVSEEQRADTSATIDKWVGLFKAVSLKDLCGQELAFAEHFAEDLNLPEYYILARGKAGSGRNNLTKLVAILTQVAALSDKLTLTHRDIDGITVWSLGFFQGAQPSVKFSLELFRKEDVIGLTSGQRPLHKVLALMNGRAEKPAIVKTARFKEALGRVKSPEDFVMFFDGRAFFSDLTRLMQMATAHNGTDPKGEAAQSAIRKALEMANVLDYTIVSVETDGRRQLTHDVARLQAGKEKSALAACFLGRKPFERFDRFIPANATGFQLTGFVDLEGLYKIVIRFIKENVTNGEELITTWNSHLASAGFDPQEDLFSWWGGEMISVSLPPAVVTPMGGADWIWMIRVKNNELASQKINHVIDLAGGVLQGQGQMLIVSPATVEGAEGFREVTHPMMMMFMRPVIGVKDGWLIIGSSAAAINQCLAVASGKAPSIVTNERFKREGLIPKGPVLSASFRDTSQLGQQLGAAVGMAGMIGGMMSGTMQGPGSEKEKQILQKVMTAIMKLGPVLQKIDFFSSEASMTTYDNALTLRNEKIVTYKSDSSSNVKTNQTD